MPPTRRVSRQAFVDHRTQPDTDSRPEKCADEGSQRPQQLAKQCRACERSAEHTERLVEGSTCRLAALAVLGLQDLPR